MRKHLLLSFFTLFVLIIQPVCLVAYGTNSTATASAKWVQETSSIEITVKSPKEVGSFQISIEFDEGLDIEGSSGTGFMKKHTQIAREGEERWFGLQLSGSSEGALSIQISKSDQKQTSVMIKSIDLKDIEKKKIEIDISFPIQLIISGDTTEPPQTPPSNGGETDDSENPLAILAEIPTTYYFYASGFFVVIAIILLVLVKRKKTSTVSAPQKLILGRLICEAGVGAGKTFSLAQQETILGRGEDATIRLSSDKISRRHAKLIFDGTNFYIEDLRSLNGTFVDDKKITARTLLKSGSKIRLGQETIIRLDTR